MPGKTGKKLTKKRKTTPITASAKAAHEQESGKVKIAKKRCHGQTPLRKGPRPTDAERRVRALNKKLRDIEALQQRASEGDALDAQQQAKLDSLGDVLAKLEEAMS
ncbi:hypothetical protein EMIHUDRAFT_218063 [Emiliania huxleyi CCMP1516]|uniref:Der GTPase-activating protein YihI n=2 Tax=Emiliania huxleyi TaxID=2903 RepID=A0A0D3I9S3_EMIH1|nr:hypothetical protein EMIHUDRAFT_218063 [Emiliania huxleyi CCMP1516]EOD08008.1 hypothetical protein EMIHUDRAFT_218063 [Emiliania huxleyi CCMP1516]|mmetsp:Transcript_8931/g.28723  ORF Transcript_8931/g.28723 Transcript_8931/m.28723 type:complete len:106 (+) Transcript_8931:131-448(+)|eukprot:CAMPEP_0196671384 /NCGR_PEP_ID=MMETSP1090-20130531/1774_1 /TAXON_ID=37098 /ORGANISM="Isochrysis sp, Strain CCMP1244" /LENGTH=105 /DNA_ID=CAMNT_0042009039 /DNA_START=111 /DNA_END=428 /DNA_ORIENTATION=-